MSFDKPLLERLQAIVYGQTLLSLNRQQATIADKTSGARKYSISSRCK